MSEPYEAPTIDYVNEAFRLGVKDPEALVLGKTWSDADKLSFIEEFNRLLPEAEAAHQKARNERGRLGVLSRDIQGRWPIVRDIPTGLKHAAMDIGSAIARPFSDEIADDILRGMEEEEAIHQIADERDGFSTLQK